MFNTEIILSTFIYIIILLILIIQVLISSADKNKINHKTRLFLLLLFALIYNIVEGLLPDNQFPIDLLSQNIIAWSVGVIVAFYTFYYLKAEFNINIIKPLNVTSASYLMSLSFILLFIIPYTVTQNLPLSRKLFLGVPLIPLSLSIIYTGYKQYQKLDTSSSNILKIHVTCGIAGLIGVTSLPVTILLFGDNQFIEQTCFTFGIFCMYIDYLFYNKRVTLIKKEDNLLNLTLREKEIFLLVLKKPNLKYSEISELLHISEKTFSAHMSKIYKKLNMKNKKEFLEKYDSYKNINSLD